MFLARERTQLREGSLVQLLDAIDIDSQGNVDSGSRSITDERSREVLSDHRKKMYDLWYSIAKNADICLETIVTSSCSTSIFKAKRQNRKMETPV